MIFRNDEKVAEVVGANPAALKGAVKTAVEAWLAGEPVTPFDKPPSNEILDFVNNYGRIVVIFIGFLIWFFKSSNARTTTEDVPFN